MLKQKEIELAPGQFKDEKTDVIYEKVTINLPVSVVDYYRAMAHFQNTIELTLIENDIILKLETDFAKRDGPDWKKLFNLYPALDKYKNKP